VLSDNFEPGANPYGGTTPDVATYTVASTSLQANTVLWVRATNGYGSTKNGLVDEMENSGANFTDPTGTQAYAFRYTNSGVTTASNKVGRLVAGGIYKVTFDVVMDGFNSQTFYAGYLLLFDEGATRIDCTGYNKNTAAVLAVATGHAPADGSYVTVSFTYTVGDEVVDNDGVGAGTGTTWSDTLLGKDLAIRFTQGGSGAHAIIDNVVIKDMTVPPPAAGTMIIVR